MTTREIWTTLIIQLLLCVSIVAGSWVCFRRTRIKTFLVLGAFIAFLWPAFDAITSGLLERSVKQAMDGQKPSLFPFSLLVRGDAGWTGSQMPVGEFVTKFSIAKHLLHYFLLAILFAVLARATKRVRPTAEGASPPLTIRPSS